MCVPTWTLTCRPWSSRPATALPGQPRHQAACKPGSAKAQRSWNPRQSLLVDATQIGSKGPGFPSGEHESGMGAEPLCNTAPA
jgi:hypothetical protein